MTNDDNTRSEDLGMKKQTVLHLRMFVLRFATPFSCHEIPLLRGAIIHATESKNSFSHNHHGEQLRYAYPLVQYKRIGGKAALPYLIPLQQGLRLLLL